MNEHKAKIVVNFRKAGSLIDTIVRMLEDDRYCVDIMQQNLAVIGLLRRAQEQLMTNHLETCFTDGVASKSQTKRDKVIAEVGTLIKMFNKT